MNVDDEIDVYLNWISRIPGLVDSYSQLESSSLFVVIGWLIGGSIGWFFGIPSTVIGSIAGIAFGSLFAKGWKQIKLEREYNYKLKENEYKRRITEQQIEIDNLNLNSKLDAIERLPEDAPLETKKIFYEDLNEYYIKAQVRRNKNIFGLNLNNPSLPPSQDDSEE